MELTEIELDILRLLSEGYSNKEIGEKRFNAESTIKYHVLRIYRKLGLSGKQSRIKAANIYKEMKNGME